MFSRTMAWLRFLRLPNVLSVPGDLLVGAVLVRHAPASALPALPAVALAYLFGMALNDVFDLPRDRRERPERPLPSGQISLTAARAACFLLAMAAFVLLPGLPMALLLLTVIGYTFLKNSVPLLGPPLMGCCRALAVWIGAGAPGSVPLPLAAGMGLWFLYIAGVSALAALETSSRNSPFLPNALTVLLAASIALGFRLFPGSVPFPGPWIAAALLVGGAVLLARGIAIAHHVRPAHIGGYIGLLFPLQAFWISLGGQLLPAALVLAGFPILSLLRKHIPAS